MCLERTRRYELKSQTLTIHLHYILLKYENGVDVVPHFRLLSVEGGLSFQKIFYLLDVCFKKTKEVVTFDLSKVLSSSTSFNIVFQLFVSLCEIGRLVQLVESSFSCKN